MAVQPGPFPFTETWTRVRPQGRDRNGDPIVIAAVDEVQTVTIGGSPTGGAFTLTYAGQTTAPIARNAAASAVQSALVALSDIGSADVLVTGGPGPGTPYVVTFSGDLAGTDVPQMTASAAGLTGGTSPSVTVATTTSGSAEVGAAELDVPGCVSWPMDGNGSAGNEQGDRRDTVVWGRVVMLPPGTEALPSDQWRRDDVVYEQVGADGDYGPNPFTGTRVLTITLRRTTG